MKHSIQVMIDEINYEIKMRRLVYPGLVTRGKLRKPEADMKINILEGARETLLGLKDAREKTAMLEAMITKLCSGLDALAPEEGEDRDDVEALIKAAHDILARRDK